MRILTVTLALLLSVAAHAADCVPQAEINAIAKSFPQFQQYAGKDFCFDGGQDSHLIAGIVFMRATQFDKDMTRSGDELFSARFAGNWWTYFTGRIEEFSVDSSCPKGVVAYVYAFGGKTMYACSGALTDQFTALDLASVFMHEARHIDGFPHIQCDRGPRQGLAGACDQRISDGGSYAVTVETYSQLAKYAQGIAPALKAYARSASVIYADEAFEEPVKITRAERFMVVTNDRSIRTLNQDGTNAIVGQIPELGHVVMRAQHMILFPDNPNSRAGWLFARNDGELTSSAGNQADEYNALSVSDRPSLVDVHIGAQWNARVYKNKVRFDCDPHAPNTQELSLSDAPLGLIYTTGYDRSAKQTQLMTDSGKIYDLGCSGTKAFLKASATTLDQKYKHLYKVGALTLGLTTDGNLRSITGTTSKPYSLGKGIDGQVREIMPNQSVDFYAEH
ncbi:MAG: hypothetical protein ACXVCS_05245 [Bdellovibrionota bacterium]